MTTLEGSPFPLAARASAEFALRARMTGEGGFLYENLSGRFAERNYRGKVSSFSVAAVTIPVNAATLGSVCGIYNPVGSGMMLEIIDTDIVNVDATTVVNAYGWYSSTAALTALATFTTPGTARSRRMQDPVGSVARVYTAVTHSGTPNLEALIGGTGAVTTTSNQSMYRKWDGTLLVPPGILMSIAATTAAGRASGNTIVFTWADVPA